MSKSIYNEAKSDLISLTAKFVIPSVEETEYGCVYDRCHFYNTLDEQEEKYLRTVEQALEQAKKQEKLLGLYREKASFVFTPDCNYKEMSIKMLEEKIKELEYIQKQIKENEK